MRYKVLVPDQEKSFQKCIFVVLGSTKFSHFLRLSLIKFEQ